MNERFQHSAEFDDEEISTLQALGWKAPGLPSACPDSALLLAVDSGVLDDEEAKRVREHRRVCETCRTLAGDLAVVLDVDPTEHERARVRARVPATPRAGVRTWRTFAGAALATAATVAFVLSRVPAGLPPALPPAPSMVAFDAHVPTVFVADRPEIARAESQLTLRGEAALPLSEQIGSALDIADEGRLDEALARLTALARTNVESADAHLALGAVLLRADRVPDAVPVLERAKALTSNEATEEFDWYFAAALARSGEPARAVGMLEALCLRNSMRGALACAGLAELNRRSAGR
jgi:hypothetical protein